MATVLTNKNKCNVEHVFNTCVCFAFRIDDVEEEEEEEIVNNHDSGIDANSQGSIDNTSILPTAGSISSATSTTSTTSGNNNTTATTLTSNNIKKNKKNRNSKKETSPVTSLKEKIENVLEEPVVLPPPIVEPVVPPVPVVIPPVVTAPLISSVSPPTHRLPAKGGRVHRRGVEEKSAEQVTPIVEKSLLSPKKNGGNGQQQTRQQAALPNATATATGRANNAPVAGETGWKEVVRKSKKVSVPAHAISRVIGRGGCNINAIRELSGAHIEVEKQGQKVGAGQAERSISIKGSAEATRQAHTWIQAIISCPDKDIADIVGKQQLKILQNQSIQSYLQQQQTLVINNSNNASNMNSSKSPVFTAPAATPALAASPANLTATSTAAGKTAQVGGKATQQLSKAASSGTATAAIGSKKNAASKSPAAASAIPAFASSKATSSFAAVASGSNAPGPVGSDNFGTGMMIQTGTHPGSLKNKRPASAILEQQPSGKEAVNSSSSLAAVNKLSQQQQEKKMDYSPFTSQSPTAESQPNGAKIASDFSPFKTFKMSWGGVKEETENKNFARAAASGLPPPSIPLPPSNMGVQDLDDHRSTSPGLPDMSKAPGYRAGVGSGRIGSPHGGSWNPSSGDNMFPERCNSAPGTPISPVVQPIGPPPPPLPLPQQQMSNNGMGSKANMSPGSEPDHYRSGSEPDHFRSGFPGGNMSSLGRSMTPDSMGDHNKAELFRRNPGGGKPGKSSTAGSSTGLDSGIVPENLLNAAAQIVSMSNSAGGGFSDFNSTGTGGDFRFSELMSSNQRFSVPASNSGQLHMSGMGNNVNSFSQSKLPPLTKPPPPPISAANSMKLNPNAADFMRIQTPGADYLRAPPSRMPSAPPSKGFHQFGATRFNPQGPPPPPMGMHGMPNNPTAFQNILTNQGINAFLSQQQQQQQQQQPQQQQQQPQPFDFSTFDVNFSGRTLRELTEMLSVDANNSGAIYPPPPPPSVGPSPFMGGMDSSNKFSRPIGSERHNMRPPPPPNIAPTLNKNPWDVSTGLYDPMVSDLSGHQGSFGFPSGLTGAGGFDGFGKSSFNGSGSDYNPGVSPMKSDFSLNSHLGGSGGKKVSNSYLDLSAAANNRPDNNPLRRNVVN